MGRVSVAQAVGMNRGVAQDHACVKFYDVARPPIRQPRAAMVQENSSFSHPRRTFEYVFRQRRRGFRRIRNQPFLATFAAYANPALAEIEILDVQSHQLADAQAAAVQQLEQREVALRMRPLESVAS